MVLSPAGLEAFSLDAQLQAGLVLQQVLGDLRSTVDLDSHFARMAVVGTPQRLTVDGHHFPRDQVGHRLSPGHEAPLELLRVQRGEDAAGGFVEWDSIGQLPESAEPLLFALAEEFDVDPRVGSADDGADGDGGDVQPLAPVDPGVIQRLGIIHNGRALPPSWWRLIDPAKKRS